MRDLVFKNLTSQDKKRRIVVSSEVSQESGLRTEIRRHFICVFSKIATKADSNIRPWRLYIFRYHNNKEQREDFLCRIKSNVYFVYQGELFLARFCHSLTVKLSKTCQPATR